MRAASLRDPEALSRGGGSIAGGHVGTGCEVAFQKNPLKRYGFTGFGVS